MCSPAVGKISYRLIITTFHSIRMWIELKKQQKNTDVAMYVLCIDMPKSILCRIYP